MSNAGYFAFAPDALGAGRPENGDARIQVVTMDRELDYSFSGGNGGDYIGRVVTVLT